MVAAAAGVLANDSVFSGEEIIVTLDQPPVHGQLEWSADGSFRYFPAANFTGSDSFSYVARVGDRNAAGTVDLNVTPVNDRPVGNADRYHGPAGEPLTVAAAGVLANDEDIDSGSLTAELFAAPLHGQVVLAADGSFVYTPNSAFYGTDEFSYVNSDGVDESEPTAVRIDLRNRAPWAVPDKFTIGQNTALAVSAAGGVLANDSDPDGGTLIARSLTSLDSTFYLSSMGALIYTSPADFVGTQTFTYEVVDPFGDRAEVESQIVVTDQPLVANNDFYRIQRGATLTTVAARGVLANDWQAGNAMLTATLLSGPASGVLNFFPDGSIDFQPATGLCGEVEFVYELTAGANTLTATATIAVANSVPESADLQFTVIHDQVLAVAANQGLLSSASDGDGDPLTATIVREPDHGQVVKAADGSFFLHSE